MNERGVQVTYESVREWSLKYGGAYAKRVLWVANWYSSGDWNLK